MVNGENLSLIYDNLFLLPYIAVKHSNSLISQTSSNSFVHMLYSIISKTDILRAITRVCKWIDLFVAPFVGMYKIRYQK